MPFRDAVNVGADELGARWNAALMARMEEIECANECAIVCVCNRSGSTVPLSVPMPMSAIQAILADSRTTTAGPLRGVKCCRVWDGGEVVSVATHRLAAKGGLGA